MIFAPLGRLSKFNNGCDVDKHFDVNLADTQGVGKYIREISWTLEEMSES